MSTEIHQTL